MKGSRWTNLRSTLLHPREVGAIRDGLSYRSVGSFSGIHSRVGDASRFPYSRAVQKRTVDWFRRKGSRTRQSMSKAHVPRGLICAFSVSQAPTLCRQGHRSEVLGWKEQQGKGMMCSQFNFWVRLRRIIYIYIKKTLSKSLQRYWLLYSP